MDHTTQYFVETDSLPSMAFRLWLVHPEPVQRVLFESRHISEVLEMLHYRHKNSLKALLLLEGKLNAGAMMRRYTPDSEMSVCIESPFL